MTPADDPSPRRRGRPPTGKNPLLQIRVKPGLTAAFKKAAGPRWPKILRSFLAWYAGEEGAELPQRPEPPKAE
jgi:hypothetical protein